MGDIAATRIAAVQLNNTLHAPDPRALLERVELMPLTHGTPWNQSASARPVPRRNARPQRLAAYGIRALINKQRPLERETSNSGLDRLTPVFVALPIRDRRDGDNSVHGDNSRRNCNT